MKKVIKKIAILTAAGATAAAMVITASAEAFINVTATFYVAGIKCVGRMELDPYSIVLTTSAESDSNNFTFKTTAQYQYYDSNGVLCSGSQSDGARLSFRTPGSSPMCPYIWGTHEATYKDGRSGAANTQYGTPVK